MYRISVSSLLQNKRGITTAIRAVCQEILNDGRIDLENGLQRLFENPVAT